MIITFVLSHRRVINRSSAPFRNHNHLHTQSHAATHCNTLQHTATHCSTLQHTATYSSTYTKSWIKVQALSRVAHSNPPPPHPLTHSALLSRCVTPFLSCAQECVAVSCGVLQYVAVFGSVLRKGVLSCQKSVLQCAAGCCSELRYVAVCCSVWQCVAQESPSLPKKSFKGVISSQKSPFLQFVSGYCRARALL